MTDVQISADDGCFLFLEVVTVVLETLVPLFDSVLKPVQLLSGVGDVSSD